MAIQKFVIVLMATLVVCVAYPDAVFQVHPYQVQGNFLEQILNTYAAILNLKLTPPTKEAPPPAPADAPEEAQPADELEEAQPPADVSGEAAQQADGPGVQTPADTSIQAQPPVDAPTDHQTPTTADSPDVPIEAQPPEDDTSAEEESPSA